jgi:endonuclease/exonuclease/phosphatase family metal-dependent hydrolase
MKNLLFFICLLAISLSIHGQTMNVATYNIRYDNSGDVATGNGWQQRCPIIAGQILFHDFDIFGTQEGKHNQLVDLKRELPGYDYIGIGRDDGLQGGEFSAIFYKTERFKLLQKGDFWMSTVTDRPNKGWDAALPRICSWGEFEETVSGLRFMFFNLHMDHVGVEARREGAKLVLTKIREMGGDNPVILVGDFNVDQNNESYVLLNTSGILRDAYELSPIRYANNGTFSSFRVDRKTESRIDHIFLSPHFTATRYGILTDIYWIPDPSENTGEVLSGIAGGGESSPRRFLPRMPSDHFPVMVQIQGTKTK